MPTREATERVVNTTVKRLERQFPISVDEVEYNDTGGGVRFSGGDNWHAKLSVSEPGDKSVSNWSDVYEAIRNYEFVYNGEKYTTAGGAKSASSDGTRGRLFVRVQKVT